MRVCPHRDIITVVVFRMPYAYAVDIKNKTEKEIFLCLDLRILLFLVQELLLAC